MNADGRIALLLLLAAPMGAAYGQQPVWPWPYPPFWVVPAPPQPMPFPTPFWIWPAPQVPSAPVPVTPAPPAPISPAPPAPGHQEEKALAPPLAPAPAMSVPAPPLPGPGPEAAPGPQSPGAAAGRMEIHALPARPEPAPVELSVVPPPAAVPQPGKPAAQHAVPEEIPAVQAPPLSKRAGKKRPNSKKPALKPRKLCWKNGRLDVCP